MEQTLKPNTNYAVSYLVPCEGSFSLPDMDGEFLEEFIAASAKFGTKPTFYRAFAKTSDSVTGLQFAKAWLVKDGVVTEWNDVTVPGEFF